MNNRLKVVLVLTLLIGFGSISSRVYAGSTTFNTTFPSNCGGTSQLRASTDKDTYSPGETIQVSGSWVITNFGSCVSWLTNISGSTAAGGSTFLSGSFNPDTWSGTLTAPSTGGTQNVNFTISTTWTDSLGTHQTTSGSGSIPITVNVPLATVTVTQCSEGGTWSLSPGGYSSSPSNVPVSSGGTTYTLNYNPPGGYSVVVTPASSQLMFPGQSYNFTAKCTANASPATVNVSSNPTSLSCPSTSTITWSSTNATSCVTNWDGATVGTSGSEAVNVSATTNYSVTCTGPGGPGSNSTTVTVTNASCGSPAPTVTLSASPTTINIGQGSTLTWSSTNSTSCTAWWNNGNTAVSGSWTVYPSATTGYIITCFGPGGSGQASKTVTVNAPPTVTVNANPTTTSGPGQPSTISWSSVSASSCTTNWDGATVGTSGNKSVAPLSTTSYMVTCTGPGGSGQNSATVSVGTPAPTVSFSANPTTINSGDATTLTWSSTDATSCTASDGWSGTQNTSGTSSQSPSNTTTYTLTCSGPGGTSAPQSVTVTVNPASNTVPNGNFDGRLSDNITLFGWSVDTDTPSQNVAMMMYYDGPRGGGGKLMANMTANTSRPDVIAWYQAQGITVTGDHGFEVPIPSSLWDGQPHWYYAYAEDTSDPNIIVQIGPALQFTVDQSFAYTLVNQQSPQQVTQGSPAQAVVGVHLTSGTAQNVVASVSCANCSANSIGYSIAPAAGCTPSSGSDCALTVNLTTDPTTPQGTYPFTISAQSTDGTAPSNGSLSYSLNVQAGPPGASGIPVATPNPGGTGKNESFTSCTVTGGQKPYDFNLVSTDNPTLFSAQDTGPVINSSTYTFTIPVTVASIYHYQWTITDSNNNSVQCVPASVRILLNANYSEF